MYDHLSKHVVLFSVLEHAVNKQKRDMVYKIWYMKYDIRDMIYDMRHNIWDMVYEI